ILSETDASPMHVGALLLLDLQNRDSSHFIEDMRRQFVERLPATPLLCRLVQAPDGYDSDVWADLAECDMEYHVTRISTPLNDRALHEKVAQLSTERLDLDHSPFRAFAFDGLGEDRAALYLKMHHSVADGIGFQTVLK